jgi:Type II secretion system (T2SS), protein M subtype b
VRPKWLSRIYVVAILCLALGAIIWLGGTIYAGYARREREIESSRAALGSLEAIIATSDEIDRLVTSTQSGNRAKYFLAGDTPQLMLAQLQQHLQSIAASHQAQFLRATEIATVEKHGFALGGIRIELTGSIQSIGGLIGAIETSIPLLFIQRVRVTGDALGDHDRNRRPILSISLDVLAAIANRPGEVAK